MSVIWPGKRASSWRIPSWTCLLSALPLAGAAVPPEPPTSSSTAYYPSHSEPTVRTLSLRTSAAALVWQSPGHSENLRNNTPHPQTAPQLGSRFHPFPNFFFVIFTKYLAIYLLKCYNAKLRVCVNVCDVYLYDECYRE